MKKHALLFGASGFVGAHLLDELLLSPDYARVTVVVRQALARRHPKLTVLIGERASLPSLKEQLSADEIFIALGTTAKKTPDQAEYYRIDHDYPVLAATLAKEAGATAVLLVSAAGADADSGVFYLRTKGEVERDIVALGFAHTHIFRPSMLMGNREESRPRERVLLALWSCINPLLAGRLTIYKGTTGADVACAMVKAAKTRPEKVTIYHWKDMQDLLASN